MVVKSGEILHGEQRNRELDKVVRALGENSSFRRVTTGYDYGAFIEVSGPFGGFLRDRRIIVHGRPDSLTDAYTGHNYPRLLKKALTRVARDITDDITQSTSNKQMHDPSNISVKVERNRMNRFEAFISAMGITGIGASITGTAVGVGIGLGGFVAVATAAVALTIRDAMKTKKAAAQEAEGR